MESWSTGVTATASALPNSFAPHTCNVLDCQRSVLVLRNEHSSHNMPFINVTDQIAFRADKLNKVNLFEVPQFFLDVYCLEPGQEQKPHAHADAAKIYYVLEGEGVFLVDGEDWTLGPGNAVLAPAGDPHGVRNEGAERLTLLVMMAPNPNA